MPVPAIGTLSSDGYVTDPKKQLSYMFAHIFETRHNDTILFTGQLTSIQLLTAKYAKDSAVFRTELTAALTKYFSRVFDSAKVIVTTEDIDESSYMASIDVKVTRNGELYSLGAELSIDPLKSITRLIKEINQSITSP